MQAKQTKKCFVIACSESLNTNTLQEHLLNSSSNYSNSSAFYTKAAGGAAALSDSPP
jgi:hypothetical protein